MVEPARYFSYLLRIWQTRNGNKLIWNASLELPGKRERQGFSSLEALFDFLRQQAYQQPGPTHAPAGADTTNNNDPFTGQPLASPAVENEPKGSD